MFELGQWLVDIPSGDTVQVTGVDLDFITVEDMHGENRTVVKEDFDLLEVLY